MKFGYHRIILNLLSNIIKQFGKKIKNMDLKEIKKDIVIGTAQLYSNYGISNKNKNHNLNKSLKFLNFAKKNNFINFDTAYAYENAHKIIGAWILKEKYLPNIYSKIPKLKSLSKENIIKIFNQTMNDLNTNKLKGLLLHNSKDWKNKNLKIFINEILNKNIISKFGFSIYEKNEIISDSKIKILQVPGNIFNQEILLSEELSKFSKNGGEVQIRSIFVQGLLLMNINEVPNALEDCKKSIIFFQNISKEINVPPAILALACVKKIVPSSKIVLGFDSLDQLKIIKDIDKFIIKDSDIKSIISFGKKNKSIMWDPRNWKF